MLDASNHTGMDQRNVEELIKKMRDDELDILVATFYKESQVGRSVSSSKKDGKDIDSHVFKSKLRKSVEKLRNLADEGALRNADIRAEIKRLSGETGVSIGQSQKVINVYLKFYCLLLKKPIELLSELDCPLDSITMQGRDKMKNVETMEQYESYQKQFEKDYGIRILKDEDYDSNRIKESFKLKD